MRANSARSEGISAPFLRRRWCSLSRLTWMAFGAWLVAESAAWDFGQLWLQLGLGLYAAAFLVGAAHQSRAAIAAERAAARGDDREAARQLRRWAWGMALIVLLLVATTWDMVFKPGL